MFDEAARQQKFWDTGFSIASERDLSIWMQEFRHA
jgi:hypothetical protein